nr:glucosaminidase domain-containing protein [Texcoconibacillus texcoconensis]
MFPIQTISADTPKDIKGHVLEAELEEVIDLEIMKGYGDGRFGPDDDVTRAQFATFLARGMDLPEVTDLDERFPDVDSRYEEDNELKLGIYSAHGAELIQGYPSGDYRPEENISRQEMALMIDRALTYEGVERETASLQFIDQGDIQEDFLEAVSTNAHHEIILGHELSDGSFEFAPQDDATRSHASAFIVRMLDVVEKHGSADEEDVKDEHESDEDVKDEHESDEEELHEDAVFQIATLNGDGEYVRGKEMYDTYDTVMEYYSGDDEVIYIGSKIVTMPGGLVTSAPSSGNFITVIYGDEQLNNQQTYVSSGSEMKYLEGNDEWIRVQYGTDDFVGYVHPTEVELIPEPIVNGESTYVVVDGMIQHHGYDHRENRTWRYEVGPKASEMENGETYKSWDGFHFVGIDNDNVIDYPSYFNVLPVHVPTNYTADDLDQYVAEEKSEDNPLYGLGETFIETQEKYGVNALYMFAKAIHEADWGESEIAQENNNLFGLNAVDSDPRGQADEFESLEDNIDYLGDFISSHYIAHGNGRYNGAMLGNKGVGMNVNYASDPYWGKKIAGHMFRADKALGEKDYGQQLIGMTTGSNLNVRSEPNGTIQFQYEQAGKFVAIIDEVEAGGDVWYQVHSDDGEEEKAYIHGDFVETFEY